MVNPAVEEYNNNRKHIRVGMTVDVELTLPGQPTCDVRTRNISEGGLFLVLENADAMPIGEMVEVKLKHKTEDGEEPQTQHAVIVRHEAGGIGLAFVEME